MKQIFALFFVYFLLCIYLVRTDLVPGTSITLPITLPISISTPITPDPAFPVLDIEHVELYATYIIISTHCSALLLSAALAYCIANFFANLQSDPFISGNIAAFALSAYKAGSEVCLATLKKIQERYSS